MRIVGGFTLILALLPVLGAAQEEDPQVVYAYVTYFDCDPATEARADEIIKRSYAPHYDAAVEQGDIEGWSWLVHFVGGKWRRVLVLTALNIDDLLDSSGALGEIIEETTPEVGRVFSEVCGQHEDYIWQATPGVDGSSVGDARGDAGFSMYFKCDIGREDKVDEIVRESLAPIYNRYVEEGKLASWVWLQHLVGGEYRRLLAIRAADHKSLMKARASILQELKERKNQRVQDDFNDICASHVDYMWDFQIETP